MASRLVALGTIADWEMRGAARSRWVLGAAVLYGTGAVSLSLMGLRSLRELGLSGAGAATDGLLALGVLFPPLIGLLLGAVTIAGGREQGTLALLAAQPIRRSVIPWGVMVGLTATVSVVIAVGLGFAAVVLAPVVAFTDLPGLAIAAAASLAAAAVGVAIGVMISALSTTRSQATAMAAAAWFAAALGMDLILATVASGLRLGPGGFLLATAVNPLESIRLLASMAIEPSALGPFGVYMFERFGTAGAAGIFAGAVAAWIIVPVVVASRAVQRRDA